MLFVSRTALALIAALLLVGCGSTKQPSSGRSSRSLFQSGSSIDEIHLFGVPVALNLDGAPGPDGIGAIIYASNRKNARGLPITAGTLELIIFDGAFQGPELGKLTPIKTQSFTPEQLKQFATERSIGTGYQLPVRWDTKPASNRVTVIARYISPKNKMIYSSPSSASLAVK